MKKTVVTISVDEERLQAVTMYMQKKDQNLEAALEEQLNRLYEKYVPTHVREYIAERAGDEKHSGRKKEKKNMKELNPQEVQPTDKSYE